MIFLGRKRISFWGQRINIYAKGFIYVIFNATNYILHWVSHMQSVQHDITQMMLLYKGNQPWIFIGRTDSEAEAPILWPSHVKSWLVGKDPGAGKDWRQKEKGAAEDEMLWWHHQFNGHEFEQTPGDGEGQGSLACCHTRGHKESNTT